MSHTDKDRPYWVKLNDNGDTTDHDHLRLGQKTYRNVPVKDEHGNLIYEVAYVERTAKDILTQYDLTQTSSYYSKFHRLYWTIQRYNAEPIPGSWSKAYKAHSAGNDDELIVTHVYQKPVTKRVLWLSYKDYCTAGEKDSRLTGRGGPQLDVLPCTPKVSGFNWRKLQTSDKAGTKKSYSRVRYGRERTLARATLQNVIKEHNAGYEVDDFNDLPITNQHRHSMTWDLY